LIPLRREKEWKDDNIVADFHLLSIVELMPL